MKNVTFEVVKDQLIITVDLNGDFGKSKTGKTTIVASTGGFVSANDEVSFGLNVVKK